MALNLNVGRSDEAVPESILKCITRPVPGPNLFGLFDTNIVFGIPNGFGHNSPSFGIVIMGLLLLVLSFRVLYHQYRAARPAKTATFIGLYIGVTGIFFFSLFTNLNIVVVVMAGLHNLLEWGLLSSLFNDDQTGRRYFAAGVVWVWIVWLIVMKIPDIFIAFGFEEVAGLWPDWVLVMISGSLARLNPHEPAYAHFFEAALWHMLQIFTLLFQGFGFIGPDLALVLSYITALPNYWYYSEFALILSGDHRPRAFRRLLTPIFIGFVGGGGNEDDNVVEDEEPAGNDDRMPRYGVVQKRIPHNWSQILMGGLVLSTICVAGPPLYLGICKDVGYPCLDNTGEVWQLSVYRPPNGGTNAEAISPYEMAVHRSQIPGNLQTRVFEGNYAPFLGYTLVLEKWADKLVLFSANTAYTDSKKQPELLMRYQPFTQIESTKTLFNHQILTKTCPDDSIYDVVKEVLPERRQDACIAHDDDVVGITLASINPGSLTFAIQSMAYGLRSRFEEGSVEYLIFFGGNTATNEHHQQRNGGFEGPYDDNDKIFVIEKWSSRKTLEDHMKTTTVKYITDVSGVVASPTSVFMNAQWREVLPTTSPLCKK